uniref:RBR-type E3 ubiquitin transferase n=1 Tax=Trichuris muris TaxID=70415 RepID=A0A5S6QZB9_TRIMR
MGDGKARSATASHIVRKRWNQFSFWLRRLPMRESLVGSNEKKIDRCPGSASASASRRQRFLFPVESLGWLHGKNKKPVAQVVTEFTALKKKSVDSEPVPSTEIPSELSAVYGVADVQADPVTPTPATEPSGDGDKGCKGSRECPVCCVRQPAEVFPRLTYCSHLTCHGCLVQYLQLQISESRVNLTCPECSEQLHPNDIYEILADKPQVIEKYEEFSVRRVLMSDPDTRWCPAPDCSYAVIATSCAACPELKCERPGCGASFCYHCKMIWHSNQTCDEARAKRRSIASSPIEIDVKPGDIKACPRCRTYIVKMNDGSCNHMMCALCGVEFCWLCLKEISDLHYLSPSGCTFWGKKPWSRKKKIVWQVGMLVGAPLGIAVVTGLAVPAIVFGFPVWLGRKLHQRMKYTKKLKRVVAVAGGVIGGIVLSPVLASLAISVGVPILLAYVYGVVLVSLCRDGTCGVTSRSSNLRLNVDENILTMTAGDASVERTFLLRDMERQNSSHVDPVVSASAEGQKNMQIQVDVCEQHISGSIGSGEDRSNVEALSTRTFETAYFDEKSIRTLESSAGACAVSLQEGASLKGLSGSLADDSRTANTDEPNKAATFDDCKSTYAHSTLSGEYHSARSVLDSTAVEPDVHLPMRRLESRVSFYADETSFDGIVVANSDEDETGSLLTCLKPRRFANRHSYAEERKSPSTSKSSLPSCKHDSLSRTAGEEAEFLILPSDVVFKQSSPADHRSSKSVRSKEFELGRGRTASSVLSSIVELATVSCAESTSMLSRRTRGVLAACQSRRLSGLSPSSTTSYVLQEDSLGSRSLPDIRDNQTEQPK